MTFAEPPNPNAPARAPPVSDAGCSRSCNLSQRAAIAISRRQEANHPTTGFTHVANKRLLADPVAVHHPSGLRIEPFDRTNFAGRQVRRIDGFDLNRRDQLWGKAFEHIGFETAKLHRIELVVLWQILMLQRAAGFTNIIVR